MARNATDRSPPTLDAFAFRTHDKVRYADTDRQGHVNNAAFSTFLETGRSEFLFDPANALMDEGGQFVIAGLRLDFIAEIHWPGRVGIGTGVTSPDISPGRGFRGGAPADRPGGARRAMRRIGQALRRSLSAGAPLPPGRRLAPARSVRTLAR